MYRLYDSRLSGNAWKVRILLRQLDLPFERVTLDLAKGATTDLAFRAKSRFWRAPVLEFEDRRTLVESCAIPLYLAEGAPMPPDDPFLRVRDREPALLRAGGQTAPARAAPVLSHDWQGC